MMGDGAAVIPEDGTIHAPIDGEITVAYETKHAYGIKGDNGAEVLLHIGIDTVNLKGENFTSNVAQGQRVKKATFWERSILLQLRMPATIRPSWLS